LIRLESIKIRKESIEIGKELNVQNVLVSSFINEGQNIRLIHELIDVETNSNILSLSQEFEPEDLFEAQDKISKEIVEKLGVHFAESGYIAAKKREPENIEAYRWYIQGMDVIDNRDVYTDPDEWFQKANSMLKEALRSDPNYALAYWGLGAAYEAYYVAAGNEKDIELAIKYFENAYEMNPELAEANLALGWAYFYKENLDEAIRSFKRAVDISPNSPLINCDVGVFLLSVGLYQHAIKYFNRSIQDEPTYLRAYELCSSCYWYIGEFEAGAELIKKALELGGSNVQFNLELARHLIMMERLEEAEKAIEEAEKILPASPAIDLHRAMILAARHERSKALELLQGDAKPHPYCATCIYALLGMKEEAIKTIQRGIEKGFKEHQLYMYSYLLLKENPCYESLRDNPRFKEIQKKEREIYYSRLSRARDIL
jgi:adenylate cyclase